MRDAWRGQGERNPRPLLTSFRIRSQPHIFAIFVDSFSKRRQPRLCQLIFNFCVSFNDLSFPFQIPPNHCLLASPARVLFSHYHGLPLSCVQVKTIGDAYIVCAGALAMERENDAVRVVNMALAMQQVVKIVADKVCEHQLFPLRSIAGYRVARLRNDSTSQSSDELIL